ncbi:MAG: MGMT family protein [bacterium]|nr:MGMT family protein [bacterium]
MSSETFTDRVRATDKAIPIGTTLTYQEVARRAGSPRAARAVGAIMRRNYDLTIPCHRVIRADGAVGGYNRGGPVLKAQLLRQEKFSLR